MESEKDLLLSNLDSNDKNLIRESIEKLEHYPSSDVIKKIVDTILKHKVKSILSAGVEVLLNFKNKNEVAKHSIKLLFSDSPKIRHAGIDILASAGDEAISYLEEKVLNHEDFNIRKYGLDILKEIKTEKALEALKKLINDENPNVKYSAIEYLSNFSKYREKVIDILKNVLEKEEFKSLYAVSTIASLIIYGNLFDNKFIFILKEKLKSIKDENIKYWIYKILIYLGDKSIIEEAKENARKIGMNEKVVEDDLKIAQELKNRQG